MISDDDICVTTMLMMMIMQMMKMENEDGDDDDNEDDDEDDDDGDDDDDATFAILCYSDRARLLACRSVSCPRAPGYDCVPLRILSSLEQDWWRTYGPPWKRIFRPL